VDQQQLNPVVGFQCCWRNGEHEGYSR